MFKEKYPSIFSRQMEAIVFIIIKFFYTTPAVLKISEHHSDISQFWLGHIQSRDAFRPIASGRKYLMDYNYGQLFRDKKINVHN